jgi:predicted site-specific integrase-resolvase
MEFLTAKKASELWGISTRRIAKLCEEGRIQGATKAGRTWIMPADTQKPTDARIRNGKYIDFRKGR